MSEGSISIGRDALKVSYVGHSLSDEEIAQITRVSTDNDGKRGNFSKLLAHLMLYEHWSPFEMAVLTVCVEGPARILRQWLRHRSHHFQEFSTRYSKAWEIYIPEVSDICFQSKKNHQGRGDPMTTEEAQEIFEFISTNAGRKYKEYEDLLDRGVAKEIARDVLPMSTMSKMYVTMTLRDLIHFVRLRTHPSAQLEIQILAKKLFAIFEEKFPVIAEQAEIYIIDNHESFENLLLVKKWLSQFPKNQRKAAWALHNQRYAEFIQTLPLTT